MQVLSIPTATHGRVLVEGPAHAAVGLLVGCHGYGQSADEILEDLRKIDGIGAWRVVAVQALHRFYTRGDRRVVASWMTSQDRDVVIADNVAYLDRALDAAMTSEEAHALPVVFAGFSQGVGMAFRAALIGRHRADGVLALGGDIPPELKVAHGPRQWPPVLLASGNADPFYTPDKLSVDAAFLQERGVTNEIVRFDGGHEWTASFRDAAAAWLRRIAASTSSDIPATPTRAPADRSGR